jgi:hypothetical protein
VTSEGAQKRNFIGPTVAAGYQKRKRERRVDVHDRSWMIGVGR